MPDTQWALHMCLVWGIELADFKPAQKPQCMRSMDAPYEESPICTLLYWGRMGRRHVLVSAGDKRTAPHYRTVTC